MSSKAGLHKDNVLAAFSRKAAIELLDKSSIIYSEMVEITGWTPKVDDNTKGMQIWISDNDLHHDDILYYPFIKDAVVNWGFSERYLFDALKIFEIFGKPVKILSAKTVSPLWIESGIPTKRDIDLVILIAPRIPDGD